MNKPIWVRWYPKDALDGMAVLSSQEELAYRRLLDQIFVTGNRLPDNSRALAWSTKAGRAWPKVKARLLELGKIEVSEGFVKNRRATLVCTETASFIAQKVAAGHASAESRNDPANALQDIQTGSTSDELPFQRNDDDRSNGEANGKPTNQQLQRKKLREEKISPSAHSAEAETAAKIQRGKRPPEAGSSQVARAVEMWNQACGDKLPRVVKITDERRRKLSRRLVEDFGADVARWGAYARMIVASAFLTGENDRNWRADFDWALEPKNVVRVLEGRYDRRSRNTESELRGGL